MMKPRSRWRHAPALGLSVLAALGSWNVRAQTAAPSAQAPTPQATECVQVPVTTMVTQYRTEMQTVKVPVTRMVSEVVNTPRTITYCELVQETVNQKVTRYVCEPTTVVERRYRPVPTTKMVERTLYHASCSTEIVDKIVTCMVPRCVTETVPVTKMHVVMEPKVCYVNQKVPVTTTVPVVTCAHSCGHKCGGGGCGVCGGVTTCVSYRQVVTCVNQQVAVTRPVKSYRPETVNVTMTRTKFVPVSHTVQVPRVKVDMIPCKVSRCETEITMEPYDVTVCRIVRKPIEETVPVCVTKMVPHTKTETVQQVVCRPVTETVERQVAVCVPYQTPVTVMTTQQRPVAQPTGSPQTH